MCSLTLVALLGMLIWHLLAWLGYVLHGLSRRCVNSFLRWMCVDSYGFVVCLCVRVCVAGSKCPSTSLAPIACTQGTYALANAVDCTTCPAGQVRFLLLFCCVMYDTQLSVAV